MQYCVSDRGIKELGVLTKGSRSAEEEMQFSASLLTMKLTFTGLRGEMPMSSHLTHF